MSTGWIKLHRSIQDHWIYPKRKYSDYEAWIDIILSVNHKKKKVKFGSQVLTCERGQSLMSVKNWSDRWGWSKSKTYRFLGLLEEEKMIELKSETITTRLTVCNYDSYQDNRNADETQMKRKRNADETQPDSNKNEKNDNNEKNKEADKSAIPSLSDVRDYFSENGYDPDVGEKAFNYYQESVNGSQRKYWRDSNENMIKNWKMKMRSVWFKDENKASNKNRKLSYHKEI